MPLLSLFLERTMPLMPWHKTDRPECRRLNAVLKSVDPNAFTVYNQALRRHEVWVPSVSQGEALLFALESDQGQPIHPDGYANVVLAQMAEMRRDPEELIRETTEHNERLRRRQRQAFVDEFAEVAAYVDPAIQQEADGALRFDVDDVFRGLRAAYGK